MDLFSQVLVRLLMRMDNACICPLKRVGFLRSTANLFALRATASTVDGLTLVLCSMVISL